MVSETTVLTASVPAKGRRPVSRSFWRSVGRRIVRDPVTMVCLTILILIALAALLAPWITQHDPYKTSIARRLLAPGDPRHWLGTDELGRDMLARLIYGGRLSLVTGLLPVVLAT